MRRIPESVVRFLGGKRIAVAGVSRHPHQAANAVFLKLKNAGYEVFPVNPQASTVEGVTCYSDVGAVPGGLDKGNAAQGKRAVRGGNGGLGHGRLRRGEPRLRNAAKRPTPRGGPTSPRFS